MDERNIFTSIMVGFFIVIFAVFLLCTVTPSGRALWNTYFYTVQKVDDATNYNTLKQVEDTCRSMIGSYEGDKLYYEAYKDSDEKEDRSWAMQAKTRANRTAATYNEYILKNSYVWKGAVPDDICEKLEYLK